MRYLKKIWENLLFSLCEIPPRALVLEVGSGDSPTIRADVLCDLFLEDNTERVGNLVVDRPFVCGDIYNLPFTDKSFDFVVCHHVLEHLDDPNRAAQELSRVANAGSVRVPSKVSEKLTGSIYHRWFVSDVEGELVFEAKGSPVFDDQIKSFMKHRVLEGKKYGRFYDEYRSDLELRLIWKDSLMVRVEEEAPGAFRSAELGHQRFGNIRRKQAQSLKDYLRVVLDFFWGGNIQRLYSSLRCPACHGALKREDSTMVCASCSENYDYVDDCFFLVRKSGS